jgi:hypothetical protein
MRGVARPGPGSSRSPVRVPILPIMRSKQEPLVVYKPMTECTIEDLVAFTGRSDNLAKRAHAELARRGVTMSASKVDA